MLGHHAVSEAPISALAEEPEEGTPAGKTVGQLVRFVRAAYPPIRVLSGRVIRREGFSENLVGVPGLYFPPLHRFVKGQWPPRGVLRGRVTRRGLFNPPPITLVRSIYRRFVPSQPPHPSFLLGRVVRRDGSSPPWTEFAQTYEQGFRVVDDSLDVYELYVGEGQAPDFSASGQPVATSPTLPFSWGPTPPVSGNLSLYLVVRKRNKFGLRGFNVFSTVLVIDSLGAEQPTPVTAPLDVAVYDGESGYIGVVAKYSSADDSSPADTWDVYVKIGSDPVPGVDAVTFTGAMTFFGVEAGLRQNFGPYTPGDTAHVLVVARRDSDDETASASVVEHVLAEALDLADGSMFGGEEYEQR